MKKVHFIGIGGIGVSALARFYLENGWEVSGSDLESSEIIMALENLGAKIFVGKHKVKNLNPQADLVIYSPAIKSDNPELLKAKSYPPAMTSSGEVGRGNLKPQSYPQALGQLTKKYFTIAVSGTHGKSTTVAMISLILIKAGFDPTVILGAKLKEFGDSNFRMGSQPPTAKDKLPFLVIEADEWEASFLHFWPKIIVLTNIEREHLDYYKNLSHILKTYKKYISHLPKTGVLVANRDDQNVKKIIRTEKTSFYSINDPEAKKLKKILKVPGVHNISNALAALATARVLKIPDGISFKALSEYKGAWRRFEIFTKYLNAKPYTIISDYAHHPTEIKATIQAAREKFKGRKIWAVFQPHQYQRTYYLFKDFVRAFDLADEIILTEIYQVTGREEGKISREVSARKLAADIKKRRKKVHFIEDFGKIPKLLEKKIKNKDIILIMGAGSIYKIIDLL